MAKEKRIEVVTMRVGDLLHGFGNPRKITKAKLEDLRKSIQEHGDFGLFLIDEQNNLIGGNQRAEVMAQDNPDQEVLCKRFVGYSRRELKSINILDNTHAGEWDLDELADWTADINMGFETTEDNDAVLERKIPEMELIHYEGYDYVMIVCRYETDYNDLVRRLGIEGKRINITKNRKIKARAIWYEDVKAQIVPKDELPGGDDNE